MFYDSNKIKWLELLSSAKKARKKKPNGEEVLPPASARSPDKAGQWVSQLCRLRHT